MKSNRFIVEFDRRTGYINSIINAADEHCMNWCSAESGQWGRLKTSFDKYDSADISPNDFFRKAYAPEQFELKSAEYDDASMSAVYVNSKLSVTVHRCFTESGNLKERMCIRNISPSVVCVNRDTFGIEFAFNDRYTYADECMVSCCNTHIWCGGNTTWINALKMGPSEINLGLILTQGSFISYSQKNCSSNRRGSFVLEPQAVLLKSGEEYVLEWELFWHKGKDDFFNKLAEYRSYIGIKAKHFTVFNGERLEFEILTYEHKAPSVVCCGKQIEVIEKDGVFRVSFVPSETGELRFYISCGNVATYTDFNVKAPFTELLKKRLYFIADN